MRKDKLIEYQYDSRWNKLTKRLKMLQLCRRIAATLAIAFAMCAFQSRCETWDETRYEYDPGTGDLLKKCRGA